MAASNSSVVFRVVPPPMPPPYAPPPRGGRFKLLPEGEFAPSKLGRVDDRSRLAEELSESFDSNSMRSRWAKILPRIAEGDDVIPLRVRGPEASSGSINPPNPMSCDCVSL